LKTCKKCFDLKQRQVERPSYDQLMKEIKENNYSVVGRLYGVTMRLENGKRIMLNIYQKQLTIIFKIKNSGG